MRLLPQLVGVPYDASSSFLRGSGAAPPLIRQSVRSPAGNRYTERGADLTPLADAGDLALTNDPANARVMIQAGIETSLTNGFVPIALGGDHSITYPIMRAIARQHPASPSCTSTRTAISTMSSRATAFRTPARSRGSWRRQLCARLVQVGIRTLTPHQREQIKRFGVETIEMQRFAGGARPMISGPVYVSIDIDGIDPAFAPGVSHREPGGLSVREVLTMIHSLDGPIVGADVVEFNPSQDLGNVTASVAAKIVREIAGAILLG